MKLLKFQLLETLQARMGKACGCTRMRPQAPIYALLKTRVIRGKPKTYGVCPYFLMIHSFSTLLYFLLLHSLNVLSPCIQLLIYYFLSNNYFHLFLTSYLSNSLKHNENYSVYNALQVFLCVCL